MEERENEIDDEATDNDSSDAVFWISSTFCR
jgi:hypothetical protein